LTHETTCASEMLEKTTCKNFCQKRPPTSGGTPGQATRGTCRLGQCRQAPAAVAIGGTLAQVRRGSTMLPPPLAAGDVAAPCRHHHWRQVMWQHLAATLACDIHFIHCMTSPCRQRGWRQGPPGRPKTTCRQRRQGLAGTGPGGTCRVFFDKNFRRWSFLAFHSRRWSHVSKIRTSRHGSIYTALVIVPGLGHT
jgi:hypothetical protein